MSREPSATLHNGSKRPGAPIDSEALKRNLEETAFAIGDVTVDPAFLVLLEVVEDYRGLQKTVEGLLYELHHPYRNWQAILPELKGFALKNLGFYGRHKKGAEAVRLIIGVFLDALCDPKRTKAIEAIRKTAMDHLVAYLEKIVASSPQELEPDVPGIVNDAFERLRDLPEEQAGLLTKNVQPVKRIGRALLTNHAPGKEGGSSGSVPMKPFNDVLAGALRKTYTYWIENEEDPVRWYRDEFDGDPPPGAVRQNLEAVSHKSLREHLEEPALREPDGDPGASRAFAERLMNMPGHSDIVRIYKTVADLPDGFSTEVVYRIENEDKGETDPEHLLTDGKILFLFKMMETPGLSDIHEETLRDIQRSLVGMIRKEPPEAVSSFVLRTFELLRGNVENYPRTALQCIQSIGREVFERNNSVLVETFLDQTVRFGFQAPDVRGVDTEWQLLCNPSHLHNIRVWIDLISLNPKWCTTLLSALIINLKLAGTCIRDTDLFQKDLSKLLNSDIEPLYNLVKQFTKLVPAFFNEIGAEGLLRDVSTEMDETHHRDDPLIHFLRKQAHVESSNLIVEFIEEIFRFWISGDPSGLKRHLPQSLYDEISESGPYSEAPGRILRSAAERLPLDSVKGLLDAPEERFTEEVNRAADEPEEERERVLHLYKMYRLVFQKYYLGFQEIRYHLSQAKAHGFPGLDRLEAALDRDDPEEALVVILDYLDMLKSIILSGETFEVTEDIYHKRHIAADIPSMYGRYHERKFDALGLTFRLENLANVYFERLTESLNLSFITRTTFIRITRHMKLFIRAMQIDGISSQRLDMHMRLLEKSLEMRRFTYTQYLDILRGLSEGVQDILHVYYTGVHKDNLSFIILQLGRSKILSTYLGAGGEHESDREFTTRISERFLRDAIASTFGLQYLDNFLIRIHQTLALQKDALSDEDLDLLMNYDPDSVTCSIHVPDEATSDLIHLGAKGYNLLVLASDGVPVPPGFIITTEVFRYYPVVNKLPQAQEDFLSQIGRRMTDLQDRTGREFGNPDNPLLVSVRSGAAISMPGMLDTLLNVGINEPIVEGLARVHEKPWFAWDNYRRFLQSWGMSHGMERETFDGLMRSAKHKFDVVHKREFTGDQMKYLARSYKDALDQREVFVPDDPWMQLQEAVHQVIYSWESHKSRKYRDIMNVSADWGTAVIVQSMAYGNLGTHSGSGVLFTANPMKRMRRVVLWGDFTPYNQGEDIVAGLVSTYPISNEQRRLSEREDEMSLEDEFPEVHEKLLEIARFLVYKKRWNPQEIEFTFEGTRKEDLFVLQTRDMVTKRFSEIIPVFVQTNALQSSYAGRGTGVSGGALSGRAVFTTEDIHRFRRDEPKTPLILIRRDTVPEDIKEVSLSDGLLTAKGGQTSHAAIVALRLGKTCVVGFGGMTLAGEKGPCRIRDREIQVGDFISIEGREGSIYLDRHEIEQRAVK